MKTQSTIITLFVILLCSCSKNEENFVKVGLLNGPSSIGMVQAMDELTYFENNKIHYIIKDNPQHLRALLQSGNMDMAILPMTMAYSMIENNINIKIFAITGWGNLFLVSRDSIVDFNEIKDGIVSIPGEGQTPDLVSRFLIEYLGLQNKISINYTYPSPLLLTSALVVNKVKFAVLPEPLASIAISKDSTLNRTIDIAQLWQESLPDIPLVQSVFVVRNSFYDKHQEWFKHYSDTLEKSILEVIAHPAHALELAVKKELLPSKNLDSTIIINCQLDYVSQQNIANGMTEYLNTFYTLEDDFCIDDYLIVK